MNIKYKASKCNHDYQSKNVAYPYLFCVKCHIHKYVVIPDYIPEDQGARYLAITARKLNAENQCIYWGIQLWNFSWHTWK